MRGQPGAPIDYLIIGHVTQDVTPNGLTLGGTVTYAARTALALGCRVAIITSAAPNLELDTVLAGMDRVCLPAQATTTFENLYTPTGRRQVLHARADPLDPSAVPPAWRKPAILHLGPLANECDPHLIDCFPDSLIGVTPQGWMRRWDANGHISQGEWAGAAQWLPKVNAAVISREDVPDEQASVARLAQWAPILVETLGPQGCNVHTGGTKRHIPVIPRLSIDPTGAGDVFAAAFFVRLWQTGDPWKAAGFANAVAALSVERSSWAGTPTPAEIDLILERY